MAANGKFQEICGIKWNNYHQHLSGSFLHLLENESMVDVTLSAGGEKIGAHRMVLSACSPFFQELLATAEDIHPTIILGDVLAEDLKAILEFVYRGELCVLASRFASVLKIAHDLKIRGLSEVSSRLPGLEGFMTTENEVEDVHGKGTVPDCDSIANQNSIHADCNDSTPGANAMEDLEAVKTVSEVSLEKGDISDEVSRETEIQECEVKDTAGVLSSEGPLLEMKLQRVEGLDQVKEGIESCVRTDVQPVMKGTKGTQRGLSRYVKKCEGVIEISQRKKNFKDRYRKEYSEESLGEALAELRRGRPLLEAAAAHHIPRSTLYVRARCCGIQLPLTRQEYTGETVSAAVRAVQAGTSLKRASDFFKIPKTVLWRKVQREVEKGNIQYQKKIEKSSRCIYTAEQRQAAIDALIRGENISKVCREYHIPKTTMFRERARLIASGQIPGVFQSGEIVTKRGHHEKMDMAVAACQKKGMTHALAALTYKVPKTTLWRRLQQLRKKNVDDGAQSDGERGESKSEGECGLEDAVMDESMEEQKGTGEEDKEMDENTQVRSLEVVVESEVTVKEEEDGTVSFVATDGDTECGEELQFPPGSSLIILTTGESIQLQGEEQIIVETDETDKEMNGV